MTEQPTDSEILDPGVVESMFAMKGARGGALLADLVAIFARMEPGRIASLPTLADEGRTDDLAQSAHQLAGACAVMGARQLQAAALALENSARAGRAEDISANLSGVQAAWERLHRVFRERKLWPGAG